MSDFTSDHLTILGARIHVRRAGAGEPLLFLHGAGGAVRRYTRSLTILALNIAYALVGSRGQGLGRLRAVIAGALDYATGRFGPRVTRPSP